MQFLLKRRDTTPVYRRAWLRSCPTFDHGKAFRAALSHTAGSFRIIRPVMLPIGNILKRRSGSCSNHILYTYETQQIFQKSY
jgi:hypothetical protein